MVNSTRFIKKRMYRRCPTPALVGDYVFTLLEATGGSRERSQLDCLWRDWPQVVGEDMAALVRPAGYRGSTLLLAVEDSMQMQEARMQGGTLLEQVNDYLKKDYFQKIKIILQPS